MYNTRLVLLFASITIANALDPEFVDDLMEKMQEYGEVCAEETHATPDDIAELLARQIPPSTYEAKCMIFCIQKKFKTMKANGTVDRAGAIMALRPLQKVDPQLYQKVLKVFVVCGMRVKPLPDACETASVLAACAKDEAEAMGLDEEGLLL